MWESTRSRSSNGTSRSSKELGWPCAESVTAGLGRYARPEGMSSSAAVTCQREIGSGVEGPGDAAEHQTGRWDAELSPRTFWTFLRELSSLRRTPRIALEELNGVSEPPMMIRMATTSRPQQRYDHRLRDLIQRTGDLTIATDRISRCERSSGSCVCR